jgi:cyclic pyranopterin phosphate synthase
MNMGPLFGRIHRVVTKDEILKTIETRYEVKCLGRSNSDTAERFEAAGQTFGLIANSSSPFCQDCDRLRMDARGKIFGCISSTKSFELTGDIRQVLENAMQTKQNHHFTGSPVSMRFIGG